MARLINSLRTGLWFNQQKPGAFWGDWPRLKSGRWRDVWVTMRDANCSLWVPKFGSGRGLFDVPSKGSLPKLCTRAENGLELWVHVLPQAQIPISLPRAVHIVVTDLHYLVVALPRLISWFYLQENWCFCRFKALNTTFWYKKTDVHIHNFPSAAFGNHPLVIGWFSQLSTSIELWDVPLPGLIAGILSMV